MDDYYRIDSRKVWLREYWNIYPSWKILIPWIAGRFGVMMNMGSPFPLPDSVRDMEVSEPEFSQHAMASLRPSSEQCLQLDFHSPRYYSHENISRDVRTSIISLLHRSGEISVRLMHSLGTQVNPPVENKLVVLMSELQDGTFYFTSDQKAKFRQTPGTMGKRLIGAAPADLLKSHQWSLQALSNPAKLVRSQEELDDLWDRYERHSVAYGVQCGFYHKLTPEEVAQEKTGCSG